MGWCQQQWSVDGVSAPLRALCNRMVQQRSFGLQAQMQDGIVVPIAMQNTTRLWDNNHVRVYNTSRSTLTGGPIYGFL